MRSPIIAAVSECASMALSAERIINGFGLPTKYGSTPVARLISAATEPVAGKGPSLEGPVGSGFVAMKRALEYGVGAVALRRSTHCGAMAYYTNRAASRGCIGFASTNGNANMAPTGGMSRLIGNNPLAYSFPTRQGFPFALDMATSVVAGSRW